MMSGVRFWFRITIKLLLEGTRSTHLWLTNKILVKGISVRGFACKLLLPEEVC